MKIKYKNFIDFIKKERLGVEFSHINMAKILCGANADTNTINKTASKLSSRLSSDGFIKEDEIIKICEAMAVNYNKILKNQEDDCANIPVLGDVHSSMGFGAIVYNESQTSSYAISAQLVKHLGISLEQSNIIYGSGNSMEPTILGGDALLVDRSKNEAVDGKIYCIRYDGQLYTKRLQRISRSKIKMISDNKDYEPILIDFEKDSDIDFEIIGEVRWCGRVFL